MKKVIDLYIEKLKETDEKPEEKRNKRSILCAHKRKEFILLKCPYCPK